MKSEVTTRSALREQPLAARPGWKAWLALSLALLIPACGKTATNTGPTITAISPQGAGVARQVTIYIDWDRGLDPSTYPTAFTLTDNLGNPVTVAVSFNSTTNEISMRPTGGALAGGITYTVTILDTLTGTDNTTFSGASFQFTTQPTTPTNGGQPTWTGTLPPTTPGSPAHGAVTLNWNAATDAPDNDTIVYDVYLATVPNGEDFADPPFTSTGGTTVTLTGLGTVVTYYFIVRPREATTGNIDFNTSEFSATTN